MASSYIHGPKGEHTPLCYRFVTHYYIYRETITGRYLVTENSYDYFGPKLLDNEVKWCNLPNEATRFERLLGRDKTQEFFGCAYALTSDVFVIEDVPIMDSVIERIYAKAIEYGRRERVCGYGK